MVRLGRRKIRGAKKFPTIRLRVFQNVFAVSGRQLARRVSKALTEKVRITESAMKMATLEPMATMTNGREAHWLSLDMNGVTGSGGQATKVAYSRYE